MSNLHVTLDEANKHTPKGFDPAVNNTQPAKDEQGLSTYDERMQLPKAINFVDGTVAPPTTSDLDVYVLTGSGTEDAGWGAAVFGDWVRFTNSIANPITPLDGYLCFDETAAVWMQYDGAVWAVFGGGGGGGGATEVGAGANSIQQSSVGSSASGANCITLGIISSADANNGIAIGRFARALIGSEGLAIGYFAYNTGSGGITIGDSSAGSGLRSISLGVFANATAQAAIAIGGRSAATATNAIMIATGLGTARTNSTANSLEINFDESTSTMRIGQSVDSWINTSANFGIGLNTGLSAKVHIKSSFSTSGTTALLVQNILGADLLEVKNDGTINAANFSVYADDTAAGVGGLVANDIYKTSTGELRIKT